MGEKLKNGKNMANSGRIVGLLLATIICHTTVGGLLGLIVYYQQQSILNPVGIYSVDTMVPAK